MKKFHLLCLILCAAFQTNGQPAGCTFKPAFYTLHFAKGNVRDINAGLITNYVRLTNSCPSDGYYSYASYTSGCFNDDWHTLVEDHTPGDEGGNMMLVNGADDPGIFLTTTINGFKGNTTYEFGAWLMNLCRPTNKCPFPLLANITIRLETMEGKLITQFTTGQLPRVQTPAWTQYRSYFTTPANIVTLILTMIDVVPGGCGNDFALDDVTFRECVKPVPVVTKPAPQKPVATKKKPEPPARSVKVSKAPTQQTDTSRKPITVLQTKPPVLRKIPPVLMTRANDLVKEIAVGAGEIKIDLYDNGEIDNDTVSIYHNNELIVSRARLSDRAITFKIPVDAAQPHHELIMVAENLGSIPPNTSLMIVTAGAARYEVRISSTEQKNAKVVFTLKN